MNYAVFPQISKVQIPTLAHKEPVVLLTKSMEALLAKSAKLQSVASMITAEEDGRQDFWGPLLLRTEFLKTCFTTGVNLK